MTEKGLFFDSAGQTLCAVVTTPDDQASTGVGLVLLHGWTAYRIGPHRIFVKMARRLARRGIASIRFDFRGRGDSTGAADDTTLDTMIDDAVVLTRSAFLEVVSVQRGLLSKEKTFALDRAYRRNYLCNFLVQD